ncbi:MAG TPA: PAS domain-containing sensor histidine kinase [Symbiobacteriaceae bacterium]|jgi:PAS domain S-box-containing protein
MSLRRLKLAGVVLPVVFLLVFDFIRHKIWWAELHTWTGIIVSAVTFTILSIGFSLGLFKQIEELDAANCRLRQEAQETAEFLENLIHYSGDGVIVTDLDGTIVRWNKGAEAIYGWTPEEAMGSQTLMVPPERKHEIPMMIDQVRVGGSLRNFETVRLCKDGRRIDVMVTVTAVKNARGEITGMLGFSKDITAEKALERQAQQLAILEEQERICMDLHDSVIQSIYGVALQLEDCADQVEEAPQAVRTRLDRAIDSLHLVMNDIRSYILHLRRDVRTDGDLAAGLADLLNDFEANSLVHGDLEASGDSSWLTSEQRTHLLQLTREALSNVHRHARATRVKVTADEDGAALRLTIADNGRGWDTGAQGTTHQMGLRNMVTRARAAGGDLQVESSPGAGAVVRVVVPRLGSAAAFANESTERVGP